MYSEIAAVLAKDERLRRPVERALDLMVRRERRLAEAGKREAPPGERASRPWRKRPALYVYPKSGLLCRLPPSEREQPRMLERVGRWYRRIDGVWYEVVFRPLPKDRNALVGVVDAYLEKELRNVHDLERVLLRAHGFRDRYASARNRSGWWRSSIFSRTWARANFLIDRSRST